jgi:hypothetical protein
MPCLRLQCGNWQKRGISEDSGNRSGGVLVRSWKLSLLLLAGSLAMSAIFWLAGFPFFFLFLVVPLLPLFLHRGRIRHCPFCGWETTGSEHFCPYDANPLEDDEPGGT